MSGSQAMRGYRADVGGRELRPRNSYTPMRGAIAWMTGSFVLFLVVGDVSRVPDMVSLCAFIGATILAFAFGYWRRVRTWQAGEDDAAPEDDGRSARRWVLISALYVGVYGLALLVAYGATSPSQILDALRYPGEAYFFRLRDARLETSNAFVQILTLFAVLSTPVVPLLIVSWRQLTIAVKAVAFGGIALSCAYWVFLGTQKGVGDFAVYGVAALMVRGAIHGRRSSRRTRRAIAALSLLFVGYMVFNQTDRLEAENTTGGFKPNPIFAAFTNDDIARGVSTTLFYPTHGYLGLAYNLDTDFEWTEGRGSSRAFDSYWTQYLGGESVFPETYPARTEHRTGWPALTNWATIYPWLASDLTYPGAIVFMGLVGWCLAHFWLEATVLRRRLALLLMGQLAILIAYIPANNQLGITRPGLIAVVTLLVAYLLSKGTALARWLKPGTTPTARFGRLFRFSTAGPRRHGGFDCDEQDRSRSRRSPGASR